MLNHLPDNLHVDVVVSVYQNVAKRDDAPVVRKAGDDRFIAATDPVHGFADHLETTLSSLKKPPTRQRDEEIGGQGAR